MPNLVSLDNSKITSVVKENRKCYILPLIYKTVKPHFQTSCDFTTFFIIDEQKCSQCDHYPLYNVLFFITYFFVEIAKKCFPNCQTPIFNLTLGRLIVGLKRWFTPKRLLYKGMTIFQENVKFVSPEKLFG